MISNLKSAKALIQADLDHARNVLQLWQDQVDELEKALAQLDAVNTSRGMLQVEYGGQKGSAPRLSVDTTEAPGRRKRRQADLRASQSAGAKETANESVTAKRRGKQRASNAGSDGTSTAVGAATKRSARVVKKPGVPSAVKYRDPASGKTWSGKGRRPAWLRGDTDQYLVTNLRSASNGNPDAAEPANQTASE